jgi:uncharacterized protein YndB with AHSA1/START domain
MTEADEPGGAKQRELTLTRVLDAPREMVWRAWTDPDQLSRWWGPEGMDTPVETITLDVRPGGDFRATMVAADGSEYPSEMAYREVVEGERLVFGWGPQRGVGSGEVTVDFVDRGELTELRFHWSGYATDEMYDAQEMGFASQLDKLDALLAGPRD